MKNPTGAQEDTILEKMSLFQLMSLGELSIVQSVSSAAKIKLYHMKF